MPGDSAADDRTGAADGPDRRERLLNLLAALIETRAGLTRDDLVTNPTLGYPPNPASARRSRATAASCSRAASLCGS